MNLRNALGSVSSLSLAGSNASLPVLAVEAGVAITVSVAVFSYKAYKHYEEKKHRKEMERINALHKEFLEKIIIFERHEIQGFPIIFKFTSEKDASAVESLHYNTDEVEKICDILPHGLDIALAIYREAILNAILKLKEYFLERKDHTDITAGVLSYLLNMLQTKCMSFQGYDYDIAYLHAMANFVNAYASLEGKENSQHFSRLNPVYSYMLVAKQALEKHKDKMSLEEMLGELRDSCMHENNLLIRSFAKLINKNSDWDLIKTVTHDEMSQGLMRREYVQAELAGIVFNKDRQKIIPDSPFKDWLIYLSAFYLDTLDPDSLSNSKDMIAPAAIFKVPDLTRLNRLRLSKLQLSSQEEKEKEDLEHQMKKILVIFNKSKNFVTTTLDLKTRNKTPKFISITDEALLIERSNSMAVFATLIHQIIALEFLTTHMLKSTKQLGEIYMKNPRHLRRVFTTLEELTKTIATSIDEVRKSFSEIQLENLNNMQLASKELFPEEVKAILDSTSVTIAKLSANVSAYHNKVNKNADAVDPTVESVKHEMFEVAAVIADMYHITPRASTRNLPCALPTQSITVNAPAAAPPSVIDDYIKLLQLNKLLGSIYETILFIQKKELPETTNARDKQLYKNEIQAYKRLRKKLIALQIKSDFMLNDESASAPRKEKASKILNLTMDLSRQTLELLLLPRDQRKQAINAFSTKISADLQHVNNQFLDDHQNKLLRIIYFVCRVGIFAPDSRRKAAKIVKACDKLAKTFAP